MVSIERRRPRTTITHGRNANRRAAAEGMRNGTYFPDTAPIDIGFFPQQTDLMSALKVSKLF